jgi:hypothetical protein
LLQLIPALKPTTLKLRASNASQVRSIGGEIVSNRYKSGKSLDSSFKLAHAHNQYARAIRDVQPGETQSRTVGIGTQNDSDRLIPIVTISRHKPRSSLEVR